MYTQGDIGNAHHPLPDPLASGERELESASAANLNQLSNRLATGDNSLDVYGHTSQ